MFEDDNLSLAMLLSLAQEGVIAQPDWRAIADANPYDKDLYWEEVFEDDDEEYDDEAHQELVFRESCSYRYLNDDVVFDLVELQRSHEARLSRLTALEWWLPNEATNACWCYWDGESDEFDITSLVGIDQCPALTRIAVQHFDDAIDLGPLRGLPSLAELRTSTCARDWGPLLEIPSLRRVKAPLDDATAARLRARGVTVV